MFGFSDDPFWDTPTLEDVDSWIENIFREFPEEEIEVIFRYRYTSIMTRIVVRSTSLCFVYIAPIYLVDIEILEEKYSRRDLKIAA